MRQLLWAYMKTEDALLQTDLFSPDIFKAQLIRLVETDPSAEIGFRLDFADHPDFMIILPVWKMKVTMKEGQGYERILVTGGGGYLASWIVRMLLMQGSTLHTTVRDTSNNQKYGHLFRMKDEFPGKLEIFEADIKKQGSFDEAAKGCSVIIHTASPFKITGIRDAGKELVVPAVQGVKNIFSSAVKSGTVRRIVMTSSVAAIYGDAVDIRKTEAGIFTEEHWNTTSSANHQPYSYSKTLAEKEAWKQAELNPGIQLSVINPGFILGPSLSERSDSTSVQVMNRIGSGTFRFGVPAGMHAIVDVRDVAQAHLLAASSVHSNMRFIAAPHHTDFRTIAWIIKNAYPQLPLSENTIPSWAMLLFGPFTGFSPRFIFRNTGHPLKFDNSRIRELLGMQFRPLEETLKDHIKQLIDNKK